jgi:hypothetical protein
VPAALLGGGALAVGFFTPAAAALAVGPGAFSVDARLFGRREIVVPRASRRSAD